MNNKQLLVLGFCIFAVLFRLLPHPPNFTPITSLAIFGGVMFRNKWMGSILPLLIMILSDIILGFSAITPWVYGSFILITILASKLNLNNVLMGSVVFFIITNFGVWLLSYPQTLEGFLMCYTLAIPFFINSLLGDLFFTYVLKHTYEYTETKIFA